MVKKDEEQMAEMIQNTSSFGTWYAKHVDGFVTVVLTDSLMDLGHVINLIDDIFEVENLTDESKKTNTIERIIDLCLEHGEQNNKVTLPDLMLNSQSELLL